MQWLELLLLSVVGFVKMEMECKRKIYAVESMKIA